MSNNALTPSEKKMVYKNQVLACLDNGFNLNQISRLSGYPNYTTIINWAESDEVFAKSLITARTAQGYKAADQANDIINGVVESMTGPDAVINEKLYSSTLQHLRWQAERTARASYGQQVEIKHSGTVNVRTSFLIPRTRQSVDAGEVIDLDSSLEPAQLGEGDGDDNWMG